MLICIDFFLKKDTHFLSKQRQKNGIDLFAVLKIHNWSDYLYMYLYRVSIAAIQAKML